MTRQDFRFRAAVCGGGITDWDMLTVSSDVPSIEAELNGSALWTMESDSVKTRRSSAVWHMKDIKTPILILHSERDDRGLLHFTAVASITMSRAKWSPIQESRM